MATPSDTPTSYIVIAGPEGSRAYFEDSDGILRAAAAIPDGGFDFAAAQPGMIGLDLLADPKLASPAGNAINTLRTTLTSLRTPKPATAGAEQPALDAAA